VSGSVTFIDVNDKDIEPQNFWDLSSQGAISYLCMHFFCSNYIGWSDQGNYNEMQCAKQEVAT
jgi:hypothetical protein